MNERAADHSDDDKDPYDDPEVIDDMVRDGIEKELKKPDLPADDRAAYEKAIQALDEENPEIHPA